MSPSLYLCVDCGGTKTSAVICDAAGQIVGRALGGPSNFSYLGLLPFINVLQTTVEQALLTSAPLSFTTTKGSTLAGKFASVWIGVSGVDSPNDIRTLTTTLAPIFAIPPGNRLQVTNDANLLASPLRVHTELKSAVTVIAGTGSVVISFARGDNEVSGPTPFKEMARVGGWGWILGDIGSGFEVGREALREILTRSDRLAVYGGTPTTAQTDSKSLQSRILKHFGITAVPDIFGIVYSPDPLPASVQSLLSKTSDSSDASSLGSVGVVSPPETNLNLLARERRLSQLTPLVFQAAFEDNDELALTVVKRCAGSLAHHIASVLAPPQATETSSLPRNAVDAAFSVLCLGGALLGIATYRDLVLEELARLGHVFPVVDFVGGGDIAAAGAKGLAAAAKS